MKQEYTLREISNRAEQIAKYQLGVFALTQFLWEHKQKLKGHADYTDILIAHTWTTEHTKLKPRFVHASLNVTMIGNEFALSVVRTENDKPGYDVGDALLLRSSNVKYHFLRMSGLFPKVDTRAEAIVAYTGVPYVWAEDNGKTLSYAMSETYCPSFTPTELAYALRKQLPIE